MIISGSQVKKLKIFNKTTGLEVGKVQDIIFSSDSNTIPAIVVEDKGIFSEAKVILIQDILDINNEGIMIEDQSSVRRASETESSINEIAQENTYLTGTDIITENGIPLGKLSDIYFDTSTGVVDSFEISRGSFGDIISGKKTLTRSDIISFGQDAIIVHNNLDKPTLNDEDLADFGMDNDSAKTQVPHLHIKDTNPSNDTIDTKEAETNDQQAKSGNDVNTADTGDNLLHAVQEVIETVQQGVGRITAGMYDKRKQSAVGQYLTKHILSESDQIIAKRGEIITHKVIDDAEQNGLLDQVLSNTSKNPVNEF